MKFKKSLKFDQNFLKTILFDLLLYLSFYLSLRLWMEYINRVATGFDSTALETLAPSLVDATADALSMLYFKIILSFIILAAFYIAVWTLFKGLIWNTIQKKHFNIQIYKKFLILNILWLIPVGLFYMVTVLPYISGLMTEVSNFRFALSALITFFAIYFTNLIYIFFTEKPAYASVKKALSYGYKKILHLIPIYLVMYIVFIAVSYLSSFFAVTDTLLVIIPGLAFLFVSAWARQFVYETVR